MDSSSPIQPERPAPRRRASRRSFIRRFGVAAAAAGLPVPFLRNLPPGIVPLALAQEEGQGFLEGKESLRLLSDRPFNAETPVTLLDDEVTPNHLHFVRNNGLLPDRARSRDVSDWSLTIDGEVDRPLSLSLRDLQTRYPRTSANLVIECGGNGRAGFQPPATGNQWTLGAVGCARYTGVRLRDVLHDAGIRSSAVYLGFYGEDLHLSRDPAREAISRGFPVAKALDEHTLLAWDMNGEPLPACHGFPLRLVCPGWPGSTSGKWLRRLWIRNQVHDGSKMTGYSYRMPRYPVAPGTDVPESDMQIIETMPVKSIITRPASGQEGPADRPLALRGHAWSGAGHITSVHVSHDFGATWQPAHLRAPANPFAWQRWEAEVRLPTPGYFELWARATDASGRMQPMLVPGWNPRGYLNNAMQRIAFVAR